MQRNCVALCIIRQSCHTKTILRCVTVGYNRQIIIPVYDGDVQVL